MTIHFTVNQLVLSRKVTARRQSCTRSAEPGRLEWCILTEPQGADRAVLLACAHLASIAPSTCAVALPFVSRLCSPGGGGHGCGRHPSQALAGRQDVRPRWASRAVIARLSPDCTAGSPAAVASPSASSHRDRAGPERVARGQPPPQPPPRQHRNAARVVAVTRSRASSASGVPRAMCSTTGAGCPHLARVRVRAPR
jgi:hypothetical protein